MRVKPEATGPLYVGFLFPLALVVFIALVATLRSAPSHLWVQVGFIVALWLMVHHILIACALATHGPAEKPEGGKLIHAFLYGWMPVVWVLPDPPVLKDGCIRLNSRVLWAKEGGPNRG